MTATSKLNCCVIFDEHATEADTLGRYKHVVYGSYYMSLVKGTANSSTFFDYMSGNLGNAELTGELSQFWYRDKTGNSLLVKDGLCLGSIMQRNIRYLISRYFRFRCAFEKCSSLFQTVAISPALPVEVDLASAVMKSKRVYDPNLGNFFGNAVPDLIIGQLTAPNISKYSNLLYFLQPFFAQNLKNKILCLKDWTYEQAILEKTDWLLENSKNICRGAYHAPVLNRSPFNIEFDEKLFFPRILSILDRLRVNNSRAVAMDLTEIIRYHYDSWITIIIKHRAVMSRFLDNYEPSAVLVPGMNNPMSQVMVELCSIANIPTVLLPDGLWSHFDKYDTHLSHDGKRLAVKMACLHPALYDLATRKRILPKDQTCKVFPHLPSKEGDSVARFCPASRVLLCFPYGNAYSPKFRWDLSFKYCMDCVRALNTAGFQNITIKVKQSKSKIRGDIESQLLYLLKMSGFSKVRVRSDTFYSALKKSDFVVGPLSSASMEAVYSNKPYFLYEPYYNGFEVGRAIEIVFGEDCIARDLDDLVKNIQKMRSAKVRKVCNKKHPFGLKQMMKLVMSQQQ
jgi:hypothetical protein